MVGTTLIDLREHVESLATDDGQYYVVCGRTGDRPVPAAGLRFPDRATAQAAARATEQYRTALRRYDPQVPYYDLIVCQITKLKTKSEPVDSTPEVPVQSAADATVDGHASATERGDFVEFCHRVAGAIFETLSDADYDAVEMAVMDAYFELAESVDNPDQLCLCLLESMAGELNDRLEPDEQAMVLADAAARLGPVEPVSEPLAKSLDTLASRGLIESYARSPWSIDVDSDTRSVVVSLLGYALSPNEKRLPVLPLVLELARHTDELFPQSVSVTAVEDGWRLTLRLGETGDSDGLVSAPIDGGG